MKKMTCKKLHGVCDVEFTAETPDEMINKVKEHAMSVNDEAHQKKMQEMASMPNDPESIKKWMDDFKVQFEAAPDA